MNVTEVPEQTGFAEAAMVTLTGRFALTVMVIVLDVAGFPVTQPAFEVITQETVLPSARVLFV